MTDVLMLTELNHEQRECVETIRSCGDQLLTVINDVLDFAKIESGRLELESIDSDVHSVCTSTLGIIAAAAKKKNLLLNFSGDTIAGRRWMTDPTRLRQILLNLLSNAVKFTAQGEVSLNVGIRRVLPQADELEFKVTDSGIGMALEELKKIFRPFAQADTSTARRFGGTGLGLAICQRLVSAMGGEISVQSTRGQGSVFTFRLTFKRSEEQKVSRRFEKQSRTDITCDVNKQLSCFAAQYPLRILLAEDNPVNQRLAVKLLEKLGYTPAVVSDGRKAVDAVAQHEYDLVLMDVQMPEMDGTEATRIIRTGQRLRQPYIVALTAGALSSDREACLAAGMDDYLSKPIEFGRLTELLQRVSQSSATFQTDRVDSL